MIFDCIAHIDSYKGIDERIFRGLKLLEQGFSGMADGRYEVDGDELFFMLQSYVTKPENRFPESHRKYVDIQCMLSGVEAIGVGAVEEMELVEAIPERDFYSNQGPTDMITLAEGKFVVLWPQDAHAPAIAVDRPAPCRKCVVKVKFF